MRAIISAATARSGSGLSAAWVKLRTSWSLINSVGYRIAQCGAAAWYYGVGLLPTGIIRLHLHLLTLAAGTRLGAYEVLALIGAGGMGQVYRARDTKLGRDVAIKVVSEGFGHHPERVARFEREAHWLATLNHPHIAAIYGLEESGGSQFLIMELVEGGTLADRIALTPSGSGLQA